MTDEPLREYAILLAAVHRRARERAEAVSVAGFAGATLTVLFIITSATFGMSWDTRHVIAGVPG